MEINTIHSHIVQKNVQNFYIFTGTEIEVQNIYIKKIAECRQLSIRRMNSVVEVVGKLRQRSMFLEPTCYVVRDDTDFLKEEKAWSTVVGMLNKDILILVYTKIDSRSSFSKHFKDTICEFSTLPIETLKKYIKKQIPLSDRNAGYLAELCEFDYSRILLECDKIYRYAQETKTSVDNVFRALVIDGTIWSPPEDVVFEWVDAVLQGKKEQAWELFYEAKRFGSATLQMVGLLYTNTKQTLQVQSYEGGNIEKATGLSNYQVKCAKKRANIYYNIELIELMKWLHRVEMGIKVGTFDENIALEWVMINFF